jgi:DNA-binding response OmpR family regulator
MNGPNPAKPGKTLLIVEDEVLAAMALRDELEDAGYHVLDLTGRHQEALAMARECRPDLALVNIQLQGRDDGIALAAELKTMGIPVLFISGQVSRAQSARTVAVGSLPKPYSPVEMVQAVNYLMGHLAGDGSRLKPRALEVFEPQIDEADPTPEAIA